MAAQGQPLKEKIPASVRGKRSSSCPCQEFVSLAKKYLATAEMSTATRLIYDRHFTRYSDLIGSRSWSSPLVLQEYLFSLAPVARCRAFAVFKRFFAVMVSACELPSNPTQVLTPPPNPTPCRQGLTAEQLASFLSVLDAACVDQHRGRRCPSERLRLMVRLTLSYGVRPGQHLEMVVSDLDLTGGSIRIPPKTHRDSPRRVALSTNLLAQFLQYSSWRSRLPQVSERLWVNSFGQPLTHAALCRQVEEFTERAGIARFSGLHFLRHTVARMMVEEGSNLFDVQRYLNHKRISYTDSYLRQNFPQAVFDASLLIESKLARLSSITGPEAAGRASEAAGAGTDKPPAPALPLKKGNLP